MLLKLFSCAPHTVPLPGAFSAGDGGSEVEDQDAAFEEGVGKSECPVDGYSVFVKERPGADDSI